MKKVISLFSVVALMFTMMASVVMADDNNKIYLDNVNKTDTDITFDVMLKSATKVTGVSVSLDTANLVAAGIDAKNDVTFPATGDFGMVDAKVGRKGDKINITGVSGSGANMSAGTLLATVKISLANQTKDFTLPVVKLEVNDVDVSADYTDEVTGYKVEKQAVTPPEPEKFEAKVSGDEITFENAALSTDNKEIGGKAIKIFGKKFTVKADSTSKFVITYDQDGKNETKTFGKTAAEYLGIEGKGDATANVTVGIIYDKEQYKASGFSIATE